MSFLQAQVIGCEFPVNESMIYILKDVFKQEHTYSNITYWLVHENVVTRGL